MRLWRDEEVPEGLETLLEETRGSDPVADHRNEVHNALQENSRYVLYVDSHDRERVSIGTVEDGEFDVELAFYRGRDYGDKEVYSRLPRGIISELSYSLEELSDGQEGSHPLGSFKSYKFVEMPDLEK